MAFAALRQGARAQHQGVALAAQGEVIAQVVESDFARSGIHDVVLPGHGALAAVHRADDAGAAQAQRVVKGFEIFTVAAYQIVVGGEHMHRRAAERGHGRCQCGGQGLAFAGGHLDQAAVEHRPGREHLAVVGRLAQAAPHRLGGKGQAGAGHAVGQALGFQAAAHAGHGTLESGGVERREVRARGGEHLRHAGR